MVFTGRESVNSLSTLFRMGGEEKCKKVTASFPQHFLNFSFNPFSTQFQIIEPEPRPSLKKIGFSCKICIKFEL